MQANLYIYIYIYSYISTSPHEQDVSQKKSVLAEFNRFDFSVFLLLGLFAIPRLKSLVSVTIYP